MLHTTRPPISYVDNPQMYLNSLFSGRDIADGDILIENPKIWNKWLLACVIAIYRWAIQYARETLNDREILARLQAIDLPAKWAQWKLDIRSDLNWLYTVLCWAMMPLETLDNKRKIDFFLKLNKRGRLSVKIRTYGILDKAPTWSDVAENKLEEGLHDALDELILAGKNSVDWILASSKKEW